MAPEQNRILHVEAPSLFASTMVRPHGRGGWITEVRLGDGASVAKWFATEVEARRYPRELAEWLATGSE